MKGIYCYRDKKTNSIVYIGKDSYIDKNNRYRAHKSPSCYNAQHFNQVLQNNPDRYEYEVLKKGDFKENLLNALEILYIRRYKPKFNFTIGGDGLKGKKHSEESKVKIGEATKKYTLWNAGVCEYRKDVMKGNPCKCFGYKYKGYRIRFGFFIDFVTPEIINDLVESFKAPK